MYQSFSPSIWASEARDEDDSDSENEEKTEENEFAARRRRRQLEDETVSAPSNRCFLMVFMHLETFRRRLLEGPGVSQRTGLLYS